MAIEDLIKNLETNHTPIQFSFLHLVKSIDDYLSDQDTNLTKSLNSIAPAKGSEYLNSKTKRILDLLLSIPLSIISTPVILLLILYVILEDGNPVFYKHKRISTKGEELTVYKIRSMKKGSEDLVLRGEINPLNYLPEKDPRVTKVGSVIRRFEIDEFPQIFQILIGQMTLFGFRPSTLYVHEKLKILWSKNKYDEWTNYLKESNANGLSGLNQVSKHNNKDDSLRFIRDKYYSENANLALDLYLIWKTILKILRWHNKIHNLES